MIIFNIEMEFQKRHLYTQHDFDDLLWGPRSFTDRDYYEFHELNAYHANCNVFYYKGKYDISYVVYGLDNEGFDGWGFNECGIDKVTGTPYNNHGYNR